jgi:hypothetical protein
MKFFISSGRIGIKYIGEYLGADRRSLEIFIPKNLSKCVLRTIINYFYPTQSISKSTKAVLVYHEYGYPQKKEVFEESKNRDLYIIEDCAHSYYTVSKDYNIGDMGNVSIYSLPKFFDCTMGGFLSTNDKGLIASLRSKKTKTKDIVLYYIARLLRYIFYKNESFFLNICYSFIEDIDFFYGRIPEINRESNDQKLIKEILNIKSMPYFLIFYPDNISNNDRVFFKEYMFDINRNLFNPIHKKMLIIVLDDFLKNKDVQEAVFRNKSSFYREGLL